MPFTSTWHINLQYYVQFYLKTIYLKTKLLGLGKKIQIDWMINDTELFLYEEIFNARRFSRQKWLHRNYFS